MVTLAAYEFTIAMSRRMDRRAGIKHSREGGRGFAEVLDQIRSGGTPGLGIYFGCRELGRCVFLAAVVCYA